MASICVLCRNFCRIALHLHVLCLLSLCQIWYCIVNSPWPTDALLHIVSLKEHMFSIVYINTVFIFIFIQSFIHCTLDNISNNCIFGGVLGVLFFVLHPSIWCGKWIKRNSHNPSLVGKRKTEPPEWKSSSSSWQAWSVHG